MNCQTFQEHLSEYLTGELRGVAVHEAHLKQCDECQEALRQFQRFTDLMDELSPPRLPESDRIEILSQVLTPAAVHHAPEIMDAAELCRYLGVTEEQLEREMENLPAFEFAGQLKFRKSDLDEWIQTRVSSRERDIAQSRFREWRRRAG